MPANSDLSSAPWLTSPFSLPAIPQMDAGAHTHLVLVFPHPNAPHFELCTDSVVSWRCPNCRGWGGHWYLGEVVPRECIMNYCRRVLGCHPLLGCMEEELGGK